MKVRGVIKLMEHDGWYLVRTKGSHRQFKHPAKRGTVAGKPGLELPPGTLKSILEPDLKSNSNGRSMQYVVVIEKTEKNYGAYVPDLPGCVAVGDTRVETLKLIREAIELHLQSMQADGEPLPPTATTAELVEV